MTLLIVITLNGSVYDSKVGNSEKLVIIGVQKVTAPERVKLPKLYSKDIKFHKVTKKIKKKTKIVKKTKSRNKVLKTARGYLGIKYRYGGVTRKGIDCSAFVMSVYRKNGKNLPRTSRQQFKVGKVVSKKHAKKGDLIFFRGKHGKSVGHVGIIIDPVKKLMIHASSGAKKVTISSYSKSYYISHFKGIRRVA